MPFRSKTIIGLILLLGLAVAMSIAGMLTPEMVEVIKWVGGAFMAVRVSANVGENFGGKGNHENR